MRCRSMGEEECLLSPWSWRSSFAGSYSRRPRQNRGAWRLGRKALYTAVRHLYGNCSGVAQWRTLSRRPSTSARGTCTATKACPSVRLPTWRGKSPVHCRALRRNPLWTVPRHSHLLQSPSRMSTASYLHRCVPSTTGSPRPGVFQTAPMRALPVLREARPVSPPPCSDIERPVYRSSPRLR